MTMPSDFIGAFLRFAQKVMCHFLAPSGQPEMMHKTSCIAAFASICNMSPMHEVYALILLHTAM